MSTFNNNKPKRTVTIVLACITGAVGLLFAILGAERATAFLGKAFDFLWYRFKGFIVGCLILLPVWLIWWIISSIIDRVQAGRAREATTIRQVRPVQSVAGTVYPVPPKAQPAPRMRPVCPACGEEVTDNGRFCRRCGWDFARPIEEAPAPNAEAVEQVQEQEKNTEPEQTESAANETQI